MPAPHQQPQMDLHPASCRYCLEETGPFVSPCRCRGSVAYVHEACLNRWLSTLDPAVSAKCPICAAHIPTISPYEEYLIGENNKLIFTNTVYQLVGINDLVGIGCHIFAPEFFDTAYHVLQVGICFIELSSFMIHWFRVKNKKLFWTYAIQPCSMIIIALHVSGLLHIVFNGYRIQAAPYLWLMTVTHLLSPIHVREIDNILEKMNRRITGGLLWIGS